MVVVRLANDIDLGRQGRKRNPFRLRHRDGGATDNHSVTRALHEFSAFIAQYEQPIRTRVVDQVRKVRTVKFKDLLGIEEKVHGHGPQIVTDYIHRHRVLFFDGVETVSARIVGDSLNPFVGIYQVKIHGNRRSGLLVDACSRGFNSHNRDVV